MNILNTLAYGTALGLGTPQQQRDQVFREQELAQRKLLADQEIARRREEDAIQNKRWEMQYGQASPQELAMFGPLFQESGVSLPQAGVSRPMLQQLLTSLNTLAMREPNVVYDPTSLEQVGETRSMKPQTLPGQPAEDFRLPSSITSAAPKGPTTITTEIPERAAGVARPSSYAQMLARRREQETEDRRATEASEKAGEATQKLTEIQQARAAYEQGTDIKRILAQFPRVTAKDVYGYEPANPTKEGTGGAKNLEQRYLEIVEKPKAQWTEAEQQIVSQYQGAHPDRKAMENDRNADRDAKAKDQVINAIDTRYNGYMTQFGPMGAFSQPPVQGARPVQPMSKGEYIALTEPKERYKTYFGKEAPDLKKVKARRTLAIAQSMFPNANLAQLKQAAAGGDTAAQQKLETILNQAASVLKREIAELPEE